MKRSWLFGVALSAAVLTGSFAHAEIVSVGLQSPAVNGGAITTVASNNTFAGFVGSYGNFNLSSFGSTDGLNFATNTLTVASTGGGTLSIYVTASGVIEPTGLTSFTSSFANNSMPAGWTLQTQTFLNTNNQVFGTNTELGSASFSAIGTNVDPNVVLDVGAGPYSLTTLYIITATGAGQLTANIQIDRVAANAPGDVPLPAALPLFAAGLGGLGLLQLRRRRKNAA